MVSPVSLSLSEARRIALAAQGFGARPKKVGKRELLALAERIGAFQIDSVNVLARAHYVPAFARLGPYPLQMLDSLAYESRELFEYWGHAASLMPLSLYPFLRYRMHSEVTVRYMASEKGSYLKQVYEEVAERGPLGAGGLSAPGKRSGKWWGWGDGKAALEYLFNSGLVAIAGRRGFERQYDLAERVIPEHVRNIPPPSREVSMKELICFGARAYGLGTAKDIAYYFKVDDFQDRTSQEPWWERDGKRGRSVPLVPRLVRELVDEGRLIQAEVEGWVEPAYLHPAAPRPRKLDVAALMTPFDSLAWDRARLKRLFGMDYTIEMYTPPPKRIYGYYVCPFLLGECMAARLDLKADRKAGALVVQGAFLEPGREAAEVAPRLADELRSMQSWLRLETVTIVSNGDLAPSLAAFFRSS